MRAGVGVLFGVTGSLGPAHALDFSPGPHGCDSFCVSPSISSYSQEDNHLWFLQPQIPEDAGLTSRDWRCPLLFILSQNNIALDF